ncbi:hypothetical protein PV10_03135 [Exophiala mesophila]|uniref:Ribosome recycling factor domain-containing protein n=1 Tax=Exophiala mesophila TaxID=212818 RepID=A0A0D2A942_EXOME|nr:uncharacterized protein PV10_03135 [Exophiala mesophila]KIV95483.1 hypothetical protein PV10_03135 [Exophiala mesophila]
MSNPGARFVSQSLLQTLKAPHSASRPARAFICRQCRQLLAEKPSPTSTQLVQAARLFSTSSAFQKKSSASSKSARSSPEVGSPKNKSAHIPDNAATRNKDAEVDPYDFTDLNEGLATAMARLKDALTKTRDAGRVTPENLGQLPVEINIKGKEAHGGSAHKERVKIQDLASVAPKGGRTLQVFAAEEAHVKPLLSALASSQHSLVPAVDSNNPLCIIVPIPPATAETRAQAKAEAKKCFERASNDVRNARGDQQKRHRKMELEKLVIKDELRKAHKQMEEVVRKAQDEVKKVYEAAVKSLDA